MTINNAIMDIDEYICAHIEAEPPALHTLWRRTHLRHVNPRMCSGHLQGRWLKMLTQIARPRRVLEIGTYTGYATLCIAEGLAPDGEIDTIEVNADLADELRQTFAGDSRIHLHIGDALKVIDHLEGMWDMVFIDADKRRYVDYFQVVVGCVPSGGLIIADNTLWDGHVLSTPVPADAQTAGIMAFNDLVAADPRVETVMLPLRDGMTIMRRR